MVGPAIERAERLYDEHLRAQEEQRREKPVMGIRKWEEVEEELFAGREDEIQAATEESSLRSARTGSRRSGVPAPYQQQWQPVGHHQGAG